MNYQKELEKILSGLGKEHNQLLLHSCCAPCSSYVLEYLSNYFEITIFYYNPNLYPESEYTTRVKEQRELISKMTTKYPVKFVEGQYKRDDFFDAVKGFEGSPEGSERCFRCYTLRLCETVKMAKRKGYDFFATTLSISPLKNAEKLNEIGIQLSEQYQVRYLPSDFKKRGGYQRSIELSNEHGLYRQNYCGCEFSRHESLQ